MKVLDACKNIEKVKENAQKLGLDILNFDESYKLVKLGAKNKSPLGYPNKFTVIKGRVQLVGDDSFVWLVVFGVQDWFKTSPIVSFKKVEDGYEFETENSFYKLKFMKDN